MAACFLRYVWVRSVGASSASRCRRRRYGLLFLSLSLDILLMEKNQNSTSIAPLQIMFSTISHNAEEHEIEIMAWLAGGWGPVSGPPGHNIGVEASPFSGLLKIEILFSFYPLFISLVTRH